MDSTQEAFVRAYQIWKRLRDTTWAEGWVMTTSLNLCRKEHRLARRDKESALIATPKMSSPKAELIDLLEGMKKLSPRQRQVVTLFYLEDLSIAQLAELLHISEGAVKKHLYRGRTMLRSSPELEGSNREE